MGYRIMYSPEGGAKYPAKVKKPGRGKWFAAGIVALAMLVGLAKPEIREKCAQWLLPGDPGTTKAALEVMLEELRSGDGVKEAVTAFCREILDYGTEPAIHHT